jgi:transposase
MTPEVRAFVDALLARIEELEAEVKSLREELGSERKTPQNSSLPPSTQHPHAKPPWPTGSKSIRKRGGRGAPRRFNGD